MSNLLDAYYIAIDGVFGMRL
uniref:Uncharacterized protein n=1 Tax=Arundo donax TaxID=35708 RepID=A0A0A9HAN1_ARUDO